MSVFGRNRDISCILAPLNNMSEHAAIFTALADALPSRHDWYRRRFWGDAAHTHMILILSRTQKIRDLVDVVTDIPPEDLQSLTDQADQKGIQHFEVSFNGAFAMVYY